MYKLVVCIGSSCHIKGSSKVVEQIQYLISKYNLNDKVELSGTFCMKNCQKGVCVKLNDEMFSLTPETVNSFFETHILEKLNDND